MEQNKLKAVTVHFCTIKNRNVNWGKSKEYPTVSQLLAAMGPYLEKHPNTTIQLQTRTVYV